MPDQVWADHRDMLRIRDIGSMFRLARQWAGASQQRIAAATGLPQSRVSALMNDRSGPVSSIDVLQRIADGLDLPDLARIDLGLAPRHAPGSTLRAPVATGGPARTLDVTADPSGVGRAHAPRRREQTEEDAADRRQALRTGATALLGAVLGATTDEPFDRLRLALVRDACDQTTADLMYAATDDLFTREEQTCSAVLSADLAAHVTTLARLIPAASGPRVRGDLTLAASHAAALAGWVAYDLGDTTRARAYWQSALQAAHAADDAPAQALAMAYASYCAAEDGDHRHAHRLLAEAARHLHPDNEPRALAWITARQAEEAAHLADPAALTLLDRAHHLMAVAQATSGATSDRAWTAFFDQPRLGAMTVAVHARLDRPDLATTVHDVLDGARSDSKTRAVILGDVAQAHLHRGDLDQACGIGEQALHATLEGQATLGRQRLTAMSPALRATGSPVAIDLADRIGAA